MSDALWMAVLVAIPTTLTVLMPLLMAIRADGQKEKERIAAEQRQDAIAEMLARKVEHTASEAAVKRDQIIDKIDNVHTLVNGNVTELLRDKLDGLVREATLLEQNRALKLSLKQEIGPTEAASLELVRAKIRELRLQLDSKTAADRAVNGDHA